MIAALLSQGLNTLLQKAGAVCLLFCVTFGMVKADNIPIVFQSTDTPPYWSASLPNDGLGGAILKLLSESAGIQYSIDYLPIKRFRNSQATFMLGDPSLLFEQKRRAIYPIGIYRSAFFYYKPHHDRLELTQFNDLKGYTLGVLRGTLEDKASFISNGIRVEEANSDESLLKMLVRGRIDICILVIGAGGYAIQKHFPEEKDAFAMSVIPKLSRPLTIMIDTSTPEGYITAKRYQKVLADTINSQKYHEILKNFHENNNLPSVPEKTLNHFIQQYQATWGE